MRIIGRFNTIRLSITRWSTTLMTTEGETLAIYGGSNEAREYAIREAQRMADNPRGSNHINGSANGVVYWISQNGFAKTYDSGAQSAEEFCFEKEEQSHCFSLFSSWIGGIDPVTFSEDHGVDATCWGGYVTASTPGKAMHIEDFYEDPSKPNDSYRLFSFWLGAPA